MARSLQGQIAVVTGASSGIGLATAQALAARGAQLVLGARSQSKLDEAVAALGEAATAVRTDVTVTADVEALIGTAIERHGRIDILEPAAAVVDRYATAGAQLAGAAIRAGDQVTVSIAGANRDPAVFPDPGTFDVRRANAARHLAFAHGPHFCIGAPLARLETQVAIDTVLDRLPRLQLAPGYRSAPRGLVFRKPPDLRVRWQLREPVGQS
jgi:cytochrome P450